MQLSRDDINAIASAIAPAVAEAVAQRVLDLVDEHRDYGLVDAAELARVLGVERGWVYEHGERLGVIRLGDGPRPRLRFGLSRAVESFMRLSAKLPSPPGEGGERVPVPRPRRSGKGVADRTSTPLSTAVRAG